MKEELIPIPHIGEVLFEEFLEPLNISQNALAVAINVPSNRINAIVRGQRNITADTDLRLTKYFGLSKGYFLRLQANLELLEQNRKIEKDLAKIIPFKSTNMDVGKKTAKRTARVGRNPSNGESIKSPENKVNNVNIQALNLKRG
ncbi:MAG: HigA family addiction module antitoxin [Candidatus Gastranaerophilales bacterium]|nr:HigA family addiction module antitoxin [Candidatus Gastranaerophilales bacterium]